MVDPALDLRDCLGSSLQPLLALRLFLTPHLRLAVGLGLSDLRPSLREGLAQPAHKFLVALLAHGGLERCLALGFFSCLPGSRVIFWHLCFGAALRRCPVFFPMTV